MAEKNCMIIAEDSRTIRDQLLFFLKIPDLEVLPAEDGVEALAIFDANQDRVKFILTDIHMPRMAGLELAQILRRDRDYKGPIIVLTQQGDNELIRQAKTVGVNGWLIKPFNGEQLLQIILRLTKEPEKKQEPS
jgi:two-component system chemotaxis response regulator CheY